MPLDIAQNLRRRLARGLAVLWLFDALLKLQPSMRTSSLIVNDLAPAAANGQPAWLYHLIIHGAVWWATLAPWDSYAAFVFELALAVAIWKGPDTRWGRRGIFLSLGWSLVLWTFAEGLGSILTDSPSVISGTPGSSPFYFLSGLLLLMPLSRWAAPATPRLFRQAAALFWAASALVQCLPTFWTSSGLGGVFGDVTMNGPQPPWEQRLINAMVMAAVSHPVALNVLLVGIMAALAYAFWSARLGKTAATMLGAWLAFIWAIPQAFGGLFTGSGTDPGMVFPLSLLLAITISAARLPAASPSNALRGTS